MTHVATVRGPRGDGLRGQKAKKHKRTVAMNEANRRAMRKFLSSNPTATRGPR